MYNTVRKIQDFYLCKAILVQVGISVLIAGIIFLGILLYFEEYVVFAALVIIYIVIAIFYKLSIEAVNELMQENIEELKANCKEAVPCNEVKRIINRIDNSVIFLQYPNKNGTTRIISIKSNNEVNTWNMPNQEFQKVFKN